MDNMSNVYGEWHVNISIINGWWNMQLRKRISFWFNITLLMMH